MAHGTDNLTSDTRMEKVEVETMLMRTDPFRDLDRLTQQVFGTDGTRPGPR